ncbi:MAG: helix-hairpin-helix domain-containing protein [Flavobacteriales bacterium]|nr:helix-hairpin-helix domain-containing protein [Flavobacteriales bacterium]
MRRPFREHLKDLFALHRAEAQAFRMVTLGIVMAAGWVTYEQWFREPPPLVTSAEQETLKDWIARQDSTEQQGSAAPGTALAPFDPNALDLAGWQGIGLSERQARSVMSYAERAGGFRSKHDLRRLRVIRPELFAAWEPFIMLPDSSSSKALKRSTRDTLWTANAAEARRAPNMPMARRRVEVNSADTLELAALPGIGPSLARAMVAYRERLGGYRSLEQLMELRTLKAHPENYELFADRLVVDTALIRRIPINTCSAEQLADHPYVNWKQAKAIVAYRTMHGPYATPERIRDCALVTDSLVRKLAPYLIAE